jgi:hypothetical protein
MSSDIFSKVFQDPHNRTCADCFSTEITHASVSHGSLICSRCAKQHRALGSGISYVKSLSEVWLASHLNLISTSGNFQLRSFFKSFNFPELASIEFKYSTLAAKYYREMIKAKVGLVKVNMARPDIDQGIFLITDPLAYGNNDLEIEDKKNQGIGTFINSAVLAGKELYEKVREKEGFKKIEETAGKVKFHIKKGAEKGVQYGKDGIVWGANKGAEIIKNGGGKVYEHIENKAKGFKDDTRDIFEGIERNTIGRVKKITGRDYVEISDDDKPSTPPNY